MEQVKRYKVPLGMEGTVIIDGRKVDAVVLASDHDALAAKLGEAENAAIETAEEISYFKRELADTRAQLAAAEALAEANAEACLRLHAKEDATQQRADALAEKVKVADEMLAQLPNVVASWAIGRLSDYKGWENASIDVERYIRQWTEKYRAAGLVLDVSVIPMTTAPGRMT